MKEKLQNALGTFGGILYWILTILIAILPLVMIDMPSLVDFIILAVCSFLPFLSIPLWIWGLVEAIKGPQDIFAIIYYIATVAIFLPTIISMISGFIDKRKENKTEQQNNSVNEKEQIKKTSFKLLKGVGIIVGIGVTITLISLIVDLMNSDDYKFIGLMLILILVPIILIVIFFAILSKIDRKKEKQKNTNEEKDKYIVKGWKGENLNTYNTGVKPTNTNNDIDIFNYIDNESNIINLTAFIADLMNKYLKNSDFGFSIHTVVFIREILYFSQLSVLNSFKKIYHLDIRENEFLSASRYLVGITMSIPQPYLLFNEPEKENIEALNKNNQFNKDDIDILCKILFVAYHKGYAPLDYMLSSFEKLIAETDIKDYYKFKNICEDYIYKLTSQLALLRQQEIARSEKHKLNRDDMNYDNCKYSLKETPTFYIM